MDLPAPLALAAALAEARQEAIESILANMAADLSDVVEAAVEGLEIRLEAAAAGDLSAIGVRQASMLVATEDLSVLLDGLGLDDAIESLLSTYQPLLNDAVEAIAAQGVDLALLATDLDFLTALANADGARWELMGKGLAESARTSILGSVLGATNLSDIVLNVRAALNASTAHASTLARTMVQGYGRQAQAVAAERAGLDNFLYVGPSDGITRPFCAPLVGKTLTKKQIVGLSNGQIDPTLVHGGGFNCRHHWAPISLAGLDETDEVPMVSSDDLKAAAAAGEKGRGGPAAP